MKLLCKRKISIFLFPLAVIILLDLCLWASLFITNSVYTGRVVCISALILVLWLALFLGDHLRIGKGNSKTYVNSRWLYVGIVSVLLSVFFCSVVWRGGYLSLNPVGAINEGRQHLDTLYHSAIAESYKYSFLPSALINDCPSLKYHTMSHFLIGLLSRLIGLPCYMAYNYLYPIVFLPIYIFLQMMAVNCARAHFDSPRIGTVQLFIIYFANIGFFSKGSRIGCGMASGIVSESFNIALSLLFLYSIVAFTLIDIDEKNKSKKYCLLLCMMVMIFVMSWCKVSVGFIALVGTMWYIFKTGLKKPKWWVCNIAFLAVFVYYYFAFQRTPTMPLQSNGSSYSLLDFNRYLSSRLGIFGFWLVISMMSILFIWFEIKASDIKVRDFLTVKTIWIDIIIVCSILAFLPGAVLDIPGGASGYFSYIMIPVSMVLLCSKDYVDIKKDITEPLRGILMVAVVLWSIINVVDKLPGEPLRNVTAETASPNGLYGELMEIREETEKRGDDYIIYLEPDTGSVNLFEENNENDPGLRAVYVYPAVTGIGVINASYLKDGKYYSLSGHELDRGMSTYEAYRVDHDDLSYEDAKKRAKNLGKKHIIHVTKDEYVIEDL